MLIAGSGRFSQPTRIRWWHCSILLTRTMSAKEKVLNQAIAQLVEKMPGGSVIALEGGRVLDERIIADIDTWDIRRYSSTQIAIKLIGSTPPQASSGLEEAIGPPRIDQDGGEPEDDLDE